MTLKTPDPASETKPQRFRLALLIFLGMVLLLVWIINTPPGLLGKTDALGYAVCHRIRSHSFFLADRPFSLCARCTGQYLGYFWGFVLQIAVGKNRFGFPPKRAILLLGLLLVIYLADGVNSVMYLYPRMSHLSWYVPINSLRLLTGLGMGLFISAVLYPLVGQTIWVDYSPEPFLAGIRPWVVMAGGALAVWGLILSGNSLILYPLILLSTAGMVLLLTMLYSVIWILIFKKENSIQSWGEFTRWGVAGLISTLIQVMAVDAVRYLLTGTWSGFLDY
jgi:uncharacterized membrane protein